MNKGIIAAAGLMIVGLFSENSFSQAKTSTERLNDNGISFTSKNGFKLSSVWVSGTTPASISIVMHSDTEGDFTIEGVDTDGKNGITLNEINYCKIETSTKSRDGRTAYYRSEAIKRKPGSKTKVISDYFNTNSSATDRSGSATIAPPFGPQENDASYLTNKVISTGLSFKF